MASRIAERFWFPRPWFSQVSRTSLRDDAMAGLTNAAIVLPQGVAFAVIAGLPPQYGLFTAMITPVIAAIWGSSMVMVSGPTTAISAILLATLSELANPGTPIFINLAHTIMVGLFQLLAGILRLGGLIAFISHSVMIGFTSAAALLIATSQLAGALGIDAGGGSVFERLEHVYTHFGQVNWVAVVISGGTILAVIVSQRISKKLPSYLLALIFGAGLAILLNADAGGIRRFEKLPSIVPNFHWAPPGLQDMATLLPGAATVAFIGLLEAISIGRTFALRRNEAFDANQEFIGQGLSNTVGGLFQCYAGSGSFTRSGLNYESGARTPVAAIFAAGFLFVLLWILAPYVDLIPVPAMSGIILIVEWRLINLSEVRHIVNSGRDESLILTLTFFAAIVTELDIGIFVGVLTSLVVFLKKSSRPHIAALAPALTDGKRHMRGVLHYELEQCPEISFLRIEGPLFFASAEFVATEFRRFERLFPNQSTRILALKGLGRIDLTGADLLISEIHKTRSNGGAFFIVASHIELVRQLRKFHVTDALGEECLFPTKTGAIAAAVKTVSERSCENCDVRIFLECGDRPARATLKKSKDPKEIRNAFERF